jgi:uncharacterized membrane protein YgcG
MNTKFTKVMPVFLAVVAILAVSTFQVFAHNPSENEGFAHRSSPTQSAVIDDHGVDPVGARTGEDMTISGSVEAITADSITIDGKVIALAAGTMLDKSVMVGSAVKVEVILQADGTLLTREVESKTEVEHLNGDDHGRATEVGDNHGTSTSVSDDHGTDVGKVDDHGGKSGSGSSSGGDDHGGSSGKGK